MSSDFAIPKKFELIEILHAASFSKDEQGSKLVS